MTQDHPTRGGSTPSGPSSQEQALCILETYLETSALLGPGPLFMLPRSSVVDSILCSWAFERAEVAANLLEALQAVPLIATPAEFVELSSGWAVRAAARVHPRRGLQQRLNAYLHALRVAPDQGGDEPPPALDGDELPVYVCIELGTRSRGQSRSPSMEGLGAVVRELAPSTDASSMRLDAVGPLLSNTLDDEPGEDEAE